MLCTGIALHNSPTIDFVSIRDFPSSLTVPQSSKIKSKNVVGICDTNIEYLDDYFRIQINYIRNDAWLKGVFEFDIFQ
jgi:hypothetical protein